MGFLDIPITAVFTYLTFLQYMNTQYSYNTWAVNTIKHAQLAACQDPHAIFLRPVPQQLVFSLYNGRL